MRMMAVALASGLLAAGAARAEVIDAQPGGFEVKSTVVIAAPPAKVWAALIQIGQWWSPAHTYSGDARNLTLEARPDGCWCEKMKDGGVEHLRVLYVAEGQTLRAGGGLGPLQSLPVAGVLTWSLKEKDGKTVFTQTYGVGGYARGGLAPLAPLVDNVMSEAVRRFKSYVETGKPD